MRFIYQFAILLTYSLCLFGKTPLLAEGSYRPSEEKMIVLQQEKSPALNLSDDNPFHLKWQSWFVVFTIFITFVVMVWDMAPPHLEPLSC
jgi:hypothetical protein